MRRRSSNIALAAALALALALPTPARAQAVLAFDFGEKLLNKVLPDEWLQGTDFYKALTLLQESTGYMRDTAAFAREAVQVGKNVQTILNDPAQFALYATRGWVNTFPQAYNILANAEQTREALYSATHPESLSDYDPAAYVNAFDALKNMNDSRFATLAAALDLHGINEGEDDTMKAIALEHEAATNHLRELAERLNSTGLSPLDASVETALATTISASAATRAAATLHDMQKLSALKLMGMASGKHEERKRLLAEEIAVVNLRAPTWRLDPMRYARERHR